MFRQVLDKFTTCMSSGLHIRRSRSKCLEALRRWRRGGRPVGTTSSESTSSPEGDWGLWLLNQYDLENRPYPEA